MSVPTVSISTGFRKKGTEVRRIPGTKVSYHNAQLLTSSGVPSLDYYLGGGLAVGTLILIEEDTYRTYSTVLLKYYLAEGVTNGHTVFLASEEGFDQIFQELPAAIPPEPCKHPNPMVVADELKIAWRYKDQGFAEEPASTSSSYGHNYDLSKKMPPDAIERASVVKYTVPCSMTTARSECPSFIAEPYMSLIEKIRCTVEKGCLHACDKTPCSSILRIAVSSVGSPLWCQDEEERASGQSLLRFLYVLRALLRSSFAVAFVTLSSTALHNHKLKSKVHQMADYVVKLDSFLDASKNDNPMTKDFDGLIEIVKLPHLNSFAYQIPTADLAFKLRRKKFIIESLHLPPDIDDAPAKDSAPFACGSSSKLLDF